jgi:hypothetical protein
MDPTTPPPPRSGPPWGRIILFGCGGCALLAGLVAVLLTVFVARVVQKTPLPQTQHHYAGDWEGADGTTLSIRADGSGSFKAGTASVEGGQVTIDEEARTLRIGLMGIERTWQIDAPPREAGDRSVMTLDGMQFRRVGGFAPGAAGEAGAVSPPMPSEETLRELTTETLLKFNRAVLDRDFAEFYAGIHPIWQQETSAAQLEEIFREFIRKEINISPIAGMEPQFDEEPEIDDGVLRLSGRYPTRPSTVSFELAYLPDGTEWKLVSINVDVK